MCEFQCVELEVSCSKPKGNWSSACALIESVYEEWR
jgi:hypothetical protein